MKSATPETKPPFYILPVIIWSQFAGTSLWFATNAIIPELQQAMNLGGNALGNITSAVQFGFIAGTLVFAILSIADRFSPSLVFLVCALLGATANLSVLWANGLGQILMLRFITGFFLAGIYPVGMKIAADWYGKGLGKALGYLVGALVLGTAFPHLLKTIATALSWKVILVSTSSIAASGGILLALLVGNGPYRSMSPPFSWKAIPRIFAYKDFRAAAFGYFGHMWELYAFWAFVPVIIAGYNAIHPQTNLSVPLWSGIVISVGGLGCIIGGYISMKKGSAKVAFFMLLVSGICCLLSPLMFLLPTPMLIVLLLIWGFSVVGDSPQFSTVVARTAPKEYIGTALTIVNCIGFTITIFSIQLLSYQVSLMKPQYIYIILSLGPVFGLIAIFGMVKKKMI